MVRRSNVSTPCLRGEKRASLPTANARLSDDKASPKENSAGSEQHCLIPGRLQIERYFCTLFVPDPVVVTGYNVENIMSRNQVVCW
jgi:hypothetical protein